MAGFVYNPVMIERPRFIVLGTGGSFTGLVLQQLIEQNFRPVGYIQWQNLQPYSDSTMGLGLPIEVRTRSTDMLDYLAQAHIAHQYRQHDLARQVEFFDAQFLLVACWPRLIPEKVLQKVSCAALNLHPSLLPKFRGVDPISEQLQSDDREFGVSLHLLTQQYDEGDIVLQRKISGHPLGERSEIEKACAQNGAALFVQALQTFWQPGWTLQPQS